uniref:Uncharacterized protein n=1 Tax=Rhizophora mucronata TaxID=61149 RepID=A0A2P2PWZ5_RHIMU
MWPCLLFLYLVFKFVVSCIRVL